MMFEIRDDSGAVQEVIELRLKEAKDLQDQLPEGWEIVRLIGLEEDKE